MQLTILLLLVGVLAMVLEARWKMKTLATIFAPAPVVTSAPAPEPESPPTLTDTQVLLLYAGSVLAYEVSWHRPHLPATYAYAGKMFHKNHKRSDGAWVYKHVA